MRSVRLAPLSSRAVSLVLIASCVVACGGSHHSQPVTARGEETSLELGEAHVHLGVFRELGTGTAKVLITANPCFGLDFAAVESIHAQITEARNRGVAVLLVSEDLDELLALADRLPGRENEYA